MGWWEEGGEHGTTDWFQIGKGVCQGRILCPDSFIFYAVYNMRNAGLEEAHAGLKIAGRNINNLRYADDTTLMAESEEDSKAESEELCRSQSSGPGSCPLRRERPHGA